MPKTISDKALSWRRVWSVLRKEFVQLRRDRLTLAMLIGIPLIQLILFGYAINGDPKHLPTVVATVDNSPISRSVIRAIENTGYFDIQGLVSEAEAERQISAGLVQFAIVLPSDFSRKLLRGEHPVITVYGDASDPSTSGGAIAALNQLPALALQTELRGPLAHLRAKEAPFELRVHRRYNPEGITAYNVVPGLMGIILVMTLVMMTAMAMTRERERGTLENLLATPVKPIEVMMGKILPYVVIGYLQVLMVYIASRVLFDVPMFGSYLLLTVSVLIFIIATLVVGFLFSTVARTQLQAMQMAIFFFLPNIMISGFMFPFRGMPTWAQWIGEALPVTHFLRVVRGVMLKGSTLAEVGHEMWPMLAFTLIVGALAMLRYRQTLD
ncbi:MAG: ABC transporter permease [Aquabacterium sp.]|uniref:ABC transporter permease n=1 Tax=Aquabacterium sp. TaxID=1872578 RepID=UPI00121EABC5|nr:ABC transporter permease [Aquabacterium sp.]TAK98610.1 MAG: ABC transporter permease [Aquabacterium sp.]